MSQLKLKVVPGASNSGITGWIGDALKVRVSAAPENGKANAAVEKIIASALQLPNRAVRIVAGHGSPRKLIEIDGLSFAEVCARLPR
jgi:hypothetical protein